MELGALGRESSNRWEHRGRRSGRACESSSEKKLVLIAVLRSNVGNESLLLYHIRKERLPYYTRSSACPCHLVVRWPPMHEVWPPHRVFVQRDGLPQRWSSQTSSVDKHTRG